MLYTIYSGTECVNLRGDAFYHERAGVAGGACGAAAIIFLLAALKTWRLLARELFPGQIVFPEVAVRARCGVDRPAQVERLNNAADTGVNEPIFKGV